MQKTERFKPFKIFDFLKLHTTIALLYLKNSYNFRKFLDSLPLGARQIKRKQKMKEILLAYKKKEPPHKHTYL